MSFEARYIIVQAIFERKALLAKWLAHLLSSLRWSVRSLIGLEKFSLYFSRYFPLLITRTSANSICSNLAFLRLDEIPKELLEYRVPPNGHFRRISFDKSEGVFHIGQESRSFEIHIAESSTKNAEDRKTNIRWKSWKMYTADDDEEIKQKSKGCVIYSNE